MKITKNLKKVKVGYKKLVLALLFLMVAIFAFHFFLPKKISSGEDVFYQVQKGWGIREIANDLQSKGLIRSRAFFNIYAFISGKRLKLQAGLYEFSSHISVASVVNKLSSGYTVVNKVTIQEGWDLKDIQGYFENKEVYRTADFLSALTSDYTSAFDVLVDRPKGADLEGYIYPDTYNVSHDGTPDQFIKLAVSTLNKKLTPQLRQEIKNQNKTIFEIITMASILEKEVKSLEDKKIVAGVLWKRIDTGMALQVDSTVNYVTGRSDAKVAIKDTKIDSPYNTYKYTGLPKGPISNPGMDSILAAIYPKDSPYWYYLSADGTGKTIYSKTFADYSLAMVK